MIMFAVVLFAARAFGRSCSGYLSTSPQFIPTPDVSTEPPIVASPPALYTAAGSGDLRTGLAEPVDPYVRLRLSRAGRSPARHCWAAARRRRLRCGTRAQPTW